MDDYRDDDEIDKPDDGTLWDQRPGDQQPEPDGARAHEKETHQAQAKARSHRQRRRRVAGGGLIGLVVGSLLVIPGARDNLPANVPVVGRDADTILSQLTRAGLPIAHGEPRSEDFRSMVRRNGCRSSRSFVRTDTDDTGWGFICVKPPAEAYKRISGAFDDIPLLVGPLYADDNDGEVIVFGFGWPADASKTVYDAIDGSSGTYLVETPADFDGP